jgi:hypothetical protein
VDKLARTTTIIKKYVDNRYLTWFARELGPIAEPELVYPESSAPKSTRPSGSGDLVFTQQDTGTLVLL